jgi:hypothetical protein
MDMAKRAGLAIDRAVLSTLPRLFLSFDLNPTDHLNSVIGEHLVLP